MNIEIMLSESPSTGLPSCPLPLGAVVQMSRYPRGRHKAHAPRTPLLPVPLPPPTAMTVTLSLPRRTRGAIRRRLLIAAIDRNAHGSPCSPPTCKNSSSSHSYPWGCAGPTGTMFPASSVTSVCYMNVVCGRSLRIILRFAAV